MKKNSLQTTAILAFILFIAVPIVITSILLSASYKKTLHGNYANQIEKSLTQLKAGLDGEVKRISLGLSVVANDKELTDLLESWNKETNASKRFELSYLIDRQLNYIFSFNSDINGLVVFFDNGNYYYYRSDLTQRVSDIQKTKWYVDSGNRIGFVDIVGVDNDFISRQTKNKTWGAVITPKAITLENSIERIFIDMYSPMLDGIKNNFSGKGHFELVDQNGNVRLDSSVHQQGEHLEGIDKLLKDVFKNNALIKPQINDDFYVSKIKVNHNKWALYFVVPMDEITKDVKQLLSYFYLIYLIVATSFSIYIIVFYRSSIRPIRQLVFKMKSVQEGNLEVQTEVEGPNEIKELNTTFNHMMTRISGLMEERDQKEKERSVEEIRALQAQINPHFIYNTLNTIKLMAMMTKAQGIQKMLESFMKVIELTFKSEGSLLTIESEMVYVDAYIYIMKARYGSFFEIQYDIEEEIKPFKIMKMLIQPFLENAIVHGLQSKPDGLILLRAYKENDLLVVEIKDNGIGMDACQMEDLLNSQPHDLNHIGINNVKRRIELTYGSDYTVLLESITDEYTKITLKLPLIVDGGAEGV